MEFTASTTFENVTDRFHKFVLDMIVEALPDELEQTGEALEGEIDDTYYEVYITVARDRDIGETEVYLTVDEDSGLQHQHVFGFIDGLTATNMANQVSNRFREMTDT